MWTENISYRTVEYVSIVSHFDRDQFFIDESIIGHVWKHVLIALIYYIFDIGVCGVNDDRHRRFGSKKIKESETKA